MNLKFRLKSLRRRSLLFVVVLALTAAMLPTAAFASGYGNQGRGWDPGPRQARGEHRPAQDNDHAWNNNNQWNNGPQGNNQGNRPNQCNNTYRVKRGDSLSEIAQRFHVPVHQLAQANGIRNINRIVTGQVLCIPC